MWLALPHKTREKIAKDFGLKRTTGAVVVDGRVECDGFTDESLMAITEEGLNERLKRTQKSLPKEFMKKWEYYVADMSEEEVKYSNNEELNGVISESINTTDKIDELTEKKANEFIDGFKNLADKEALEMLKKITEKETPKPHSVIPKENAKEILRRLQSKPKNKGGRPKGSKSKVVKKSKK
jgi:DNA-directed RNA polymerase subunit H (RpoH/RPB5)